MYIRTRRRYAPRRRRLPAVRQVAALGIEPNAGQARMPSKVVQVALAVAVGAVAWKLYEGMQNSRMEQNLPPWPALGPLFNSSIGAKYALGPFIL